MERSAGGAPTAFWLGGTRLRSEAVIARELTARYDSRPAAHVVERRTLRRAR